MTRILFVCLGNICRSPAAEGIVATQAARAGVEIETDSAGTSGWHAGDPPYGPMIRAARSRGYELSALRARRVRLSDYDDFDLILAMDNDNLADLKRQRPDGSDTPIRLFLDYAPSLGFTQVPDPYYTRDFEGALDLLESAGEGLVRALQAEAAQDTGS